MNKLNLPQYNFKIHQIEERLEIFDDIRKKYVALTPEEWVRQHFVKFLIIEKNFPASLMAVEMSIKLNRLKKRSDVVVYNNNGKPLLIVECKAPTVKINQKVFDQIARYNMVLMTQFLVVTNGLKHIACKLDFEQSTYAFLEDIPFYHEINIEK